MDQAHDNLDAWWNKENLLQPFLINTYNTLTSNKSHKSLLKV